MNNEKNYQVTVVGVVGAEGLAGARRAGPSEAAAGEAMEGVSGRVAREEEVAPGVEASSGQQEGGIVSGLTEGAEGASGQAGGVAAVETGGDFSFTVTRRDFELVAAEIEAADGVDVVTMRVDPQKVAATVLSILERDAAPARRGLFERFAGQGNYDITLFERVPRYAGAVWYLRRQQQRASAVVSGAMVTEEERLSAFDHRGRMIVELEYHCEFLPGMRAELAHLRRGSGHQDLINDLETIVELFGREDARAALARSVRYRPGDPAEALRLAGLLRRSMGMGQASEVERLTGQLQRAVTLMVRGYEKHSVVGRFLFREVEDVEVTYPSLYAAVRNPRRKRQAGEPAGEPGSEAPEGEAGGGEQVDP